MINLARVSTFLAVATCGGFRGAAKQTGLSQPAVTQHVRRLEQALNVSLIDRSNAGSTLTPEGKAFLPYAEQLLKTWERARTHFTKKALIVGASSNTGIYLLQPYLKSYRDVAPHALEVVIGDNNSIASKLQNLEIDVAIMEWWDHRSGFVAEVWRREELVIIVPPGHPWACMQSIPRGLLKGLSMIGGESGTGTGRLLQQYLGEDARGMGVSLQLGSTEAVKHAVHAGLGVSLVMAAAVAQENRNGWLRAIPIEGEPPRKEIFMIRREGGHPDSPEQRFVAFLSGQLPSA